MREETFFVMCCGLHCVGSGFSFGVTFRTGHKKKCAAHHIYLFGWRSNQGDNKQGGTTAYCSGGKDRRDKLSVHDNVRLRDKAAS